MGRVLEGLRGRAAMLLLALAVVGGAIEAPWPLLGLPAYLGVLVAAVLCFGPRAAPVAGLAVVLGGLLVAPGSVDLVLQVALDAAVAAAVGMGIERIGDRRGRERRAVHVLEMVVVTTAGAALRAVGLAVLGGPAGLEQFALALLAMHVIMPGVRVLALRVPMRAREKSGPGPWLLLPLLAVGVVAATVLTGGDGILLVAVVLTCMVGIAALDRGYALMAAAAAIAAVVALVARSLAGLAPSQPPLTELLALDVVLLTVLLVAVESDRFHDVLTERAVAFGHAANPALVVLSAAPHELVRANRAAEAMLGPDLVGQSARDVLGGAIDVVTEAVGTAAPARAQAVLSTCAGARTVEVAVAPLPTSGRAGTVRIELVDVTDLVDTSAALARSNEELNRVATTIAHDLAQPLSAVAGMASTLREHDERLSPEQRLELLERLERASTGILDRVANVIADARKVGAAPEEVELEPLVATLVSSLAASGDRPRFELDLDAAAVVAERTMLHGVLGNLLDNAVKHGGAGTSVSVTVGSSRRWGGTVVHVVDDGPGIPPAELQRVFELGVRLAGPGVDGAGAGLAAAADHAAGSGCELTCVPDVGGARFELWIPDGTGRAPLRVLTAVADEGHRALLAGLLAADQRVRPVGTVASASVLGAALTAARPDVLLLDPALCDGRAVGDLPELTLTLPNLCTILVSPDTALTGLAGLATELGVRIATEPGQLDAELRRLTAEVGSS